MPRRKTQISFLATIELNEECVDVIVHADFEPGTPDQWYDRHGDPGTPGDPAEAEVTLIERIDGPEVEFESLSRSEQDRLLERAIREGELQE